MLFVIHYSFDLRFIDVYVAFVLGSFCLFCDCVDDCGEGTYARQGMYTPVNTFYCAILCKHDLGGRNSGYRSLPCFVVSVKISDRLGQWPEGLRLKHFVVNTNVQFYIQ